MEKAFAMLDRSVSNYRAELANRQPRPSNRYSRTEALSRVGCFYLSDINDTSHAGRRRVLRRLSRVLKREVENREANAWNYNRNRHQQTLDTFKRELAAFEAVTDQRWMQ